jgi:hypothetical protein
VGSLKDSTVRGKVWGMLVGPKVDSSIRAVKIASFSVFGFGLSNITLLLSNTSAKSLVLS